MKSTKFHKAILLCLISFSYIGVLQAQSNLTLHFTDKTQINPALNSISKITFTSDNLEMKFNDGSTNSYLISSINKITFGTLSALKETSSQESQILLYPNPSKDIIFLKNISVNETNVSVFSLDGACVLSVKISDVDNGVDVSSLSKGIYVLKIGDKALKFTKL